MIENLLTGDRKLNSGTVWERREDQRASILEECAIQQEKRRKIQNRIISTFIFP